MGIAQQQTMPRLQVGILLPLIYHRRLQSPLQILPISRTLHRNKKADEVTQDVEGVVGEVEEVDEEVLRPR